MCSTPKNPDTLHPTKRGSASRVLSASAAQANINPLSNGPEAQAEERANELIQEIQEHLEEFIEAQPQHADRKRDIFEVWAIQKIAGLQLCVEHMAEQHNQHIQGHKLS